PTLHYFLGNCYIHLKEKEGAIREFRIAYALQPSGEVGELSKKALTSLGVQPTASGDGKDKDKAPPVPAVPAYAPNNDPLKDKAVEALRQQADSLKSVHSGEGQSLADQLSKRGADDVTRQQEALKDLYRYYGRRGSVYQMPVPQDAQRQVEQLKHYYD